LRSPLSRLRQRTSDSVMVAGPSPAGGSLLSG